MVDPMRAEDVDALVVYWRPGCPFCRRLFDVLDRAGVRTLRKDIWELDEARAFVAAHNGGNETVPTVVLGASVVTNPDPVALLSIIERDYPHLVEMVDPSPA